MYAHDVLNTQVCCGVDTIGFGSGKANVRARKSWFGKPVLNTSLVFGKSLKLTLYKIEM